MSFTMAGWYNASLLKLSDSLEIDPAELLEPLPGMDVRRRRAADAQAVTRPGAA